MLRKSILCLLEQKVINTIICLMISRVDFLLLVKVNTSGAAVSLACRLAGRRASGAGDVGVGQVLREFQCGCGSAASRRSAGEFLLRPRRSSRPGSAQQLLTPLLPLQRLLLCSLHLHPPSAFKWLVAKSTRAPSAVVCKKCTPILFTTL